LYLPALVASRYQPQVREFYERLQQQALLAVARKLLHAIYGMFRTLQPFDGTRLFAFAPAKTA
jgi:transposase